MKIYGAIRTAFYWVFAALVLVFISPIAEIEVLRYFIGGLIVFYGVEEIVYTAFKHKKHFSLHTLFWNIIESIIGLVLIVFVETGDEEVTYAVVCVCWAIWAILREARELYELAKEVKEHKHIVSRIVAILNLLESLTVIALSLTMLIEPGEHHATIHLYFLFVELLTKVLFPIINYVAEHFAKKKGAKGEREVKEAEGEAVLSAEETAPVSEEVPAPESVPEEPLSESPLSEPPTTTE